MHSAGDSLGHFHSKTLIIFCGFSSLTITDKI